MIDMKTSICIILSVILACTFLCGCVGTPYSPRYTIFKPNESNLVGTWISDRGDVLELRADHSATGFGVFLFNYSFMPQDIIPHPEGMKGEWHLSKDQGAWIIEIEWELIITNFEILDSPPHTLLRYLGDPDSSEDVILLTCQRQNIYHRIRKIIVYGPLVIVVILIIRRYRRRRKAWLDMISTPYIPPSSSQD